MTRPTTLLLWPEGAPGALGATPEDQPRLSFFWPSATGTETRGFVVVCPGGGYVRRAPHEGRPIAEWLNSLGIGAAVLDYRVKPYRHPIPLGDARRAVRLVRREARAWGVDPQKIGILGFSAGGHLATSAATLHEAGNPEASDPIERESSRPNALVACYPVISFVSFAHHGSMVSLLGEDADPVLVRKMSLEQSVTPANPPTFLWHTAEDRSVPMENSLSFALALRRCEVPVSVHVFPTGRHGLGLAQEQPLARDWSRLCGEWLLDLGF